MSKQPPVRQPPGRSVAYWLREALVNAREGADVMRVEVAAKLRKDQTAIGKFESGVPHLPAEIDRYVAAYAEAVGIDDSRELWEEAIRLWRESGSPPLLNPNEAEEPSRAFERAVRETARRARDASLDGHAQTQRATQKKRAAP